MSTYAPSAPKKFAEVNGIQMAYIGEGDGDAIVFQHGNPTSSYLWRNVMPHLEGMGRLIACDLVGMGDSGKLPDSDPGRYTSQEQREYLFRLWDMLGIDGNVLLVLHDWGSALGFNWAYQHQDSGIAYMESIVMPQVWDDWSNEGIKKMFQGFRSPAGEAMVLQDNMFVERVSPASMLRDLADEEMAVYRAPYGTRRKPTADVDMAASASNRGRAGGCRRNPGAPTARSAQRLSGFRSRRWCRVSILRPSPRAR